MYETIARTQLYVPNMFPVFWIFAFFVRFSLIFANFEALGCQNNNVIVKKRNCRISFFHSLSHTPSILFIPLFLALSLYNFSLLVILFFFFFINKIQSLQIRFDYLFFSLPSNHLNIVLWTNKWTSCPSHFLYPFFTIYFFHLFINYYYYYFL